MRRITILLLLFMLTASVSGCNSANTTEILPRSASPLPTTTEPLPSISVPKEDSPRITSEPAAPTSTPVVVEEVPSFSPTPSRLVDALAGARIGLDPGHQKAGNNNEEPNAPGSSELKKKVAGGTHGRFTGKPEHEVNLDVALMLRDLLEEAGAEVIMTRTTNDVDISNVERAEMMNEAKVDFVLRIHCDGNNDETIQGASMLVPTGEYTKKIEEKSMLWGTTIYQAFEKNTGAHYRGVLKRADQTGFNWSTVPIFTIEMGFMTNESEDTRLVSPGYQLQCAVGLFNGIVACYS